MNNEILFFNVKDGPYFPHLKLLHRYPGSFNDCFCNIDILPRLQVDKGAIKFILSGSQIMCPGLTNDYGAQIPEHDIPQGVVVAIYGTIIRSYL